MKAMRLLLVSAASVAMLACSSSSSKSTSEEKDSGAARDAKGETHDAGVDAGPSLPTLCSNVLETEAKLFSSCLGGPLPAWESSFNAASSCTKLEAAVTAGTVTFDGKKASACADAVAALTCTSTASGGSSFAACSMALTGTVKAGAACDLDIECDGDSFCSGLLAKDAPCTGTCKARVAKGASCGTGDQCVSGNVCSGMSGAETCAPSSVQTAAKGADCGYDAKTKVTTQCDVGLVCDLKTGDGGSPKCATPIAEGDACKFGANECAPFLYCDPTQAKCLVFPGVGGHCGAEVGEDVIQCAAPSYCKVTTKMSTFAAGLCAAPEATGAGCTADIDCMSGRCDISGDAGNGTCLAACSSAN